jgi:hypothetical protein
LNEEVNLEVLEHAVFYGTVNSAGHQLSFEMKGEGQDVLKRWLGCIMLAMIHEDALNEALESLKDIIEFHTYTARQILPPPTLGQSIEGKVVRALHRPDIIIAE